MGKVVVLMYHAVEDEANPSGYTESGDLEYVLQREQFELQMQYLSSQGFNVCSLMDLEKDELPDKSVVITFDDGHRSDYTIAMPVLQRYNFSASFFVTSGWLGKAFYLLPEHLSEMVANGMSIGTHGITHTFFNDMSDLELKEELCGSKQLLDRYIDHVDSVSAPGGRLKSDMQPLLRECGYQYLCTSQPGYFKQGGNITAIPRFAIRAGTSLSEFEQIVTCSVSYKMKVRLRVWGLGFLKYSLGNAGYNRLRSVLFRLLKG